MHINLMFFILSATFYTLTYYFEKKVKNYSQYSTIKMAIFGFQLIRLILCQR